MPRDPNPDVGGEDACPCCGENDWTEPPKGSAELTVRHGDTDVYLVLCEIAICRRCRFVRLRQSGWIRNSLA